MTDCTVYLSRSRIASQQERATMSRVWRTREPRMKSTNSAGRHYCLLVHSEQQGWSSGCTVVDELVEAVRRFLLEASGCPRKPENVD